jgi:putative ABC transport system permease protein
MLKNYFKIAIAVLMRRKFFTLISLFGISFTLTILLVMTAFIDKVINDDYPDRKRDRSLYVNKIELRGDQSMNAGPLSLYYFERYVSTLKKPVKIGISSGFSSTNSYINNKKITINYKYTNADYWDIMEYDFLEGKAITRQQIDNAEKVVVISEAIKKEYFGDEASVVGKFIETDNVEYKVCGVVKNVPVTLYMLYSDIYLPYTVAKNGNDDTGYMGHYTGVLLAESKSALPAMQKEYDEMVSKLPLPPGTEFKKIFSHADTFIRGYVRTGNEESSGVTIAMIALAIFVLLIMLLPTLNLVNINITRIMERSSEIGVRKAFGASSKTLVYQFIVENIILTLIGGAIGFLFAVVVIWVLNDANLINNLHLSLNFNVLWIGILICLIFGLLSGVFPAWRMSKLNVVTALKAQ